MAQKILILDDDHGFLTLTEKMLRQAGYEVVTLQHPSRLFKTLKTEQPDLVILDILLPSQDGYKLCEDVKGLYGERFPVLLCTAKEYEKEFIREAYKDFGADDYMIKPFESGAFLRKLRDLLGPLPDTESKGGAA